MSNENQGFVDVGVSDIFGFFLEKERIEAGAKMQALGGQSLTQRQALHAPNIDSMGDAVNTGYAAPGNSQGTQGFIASVPKPVLYSGLGVLAAVVLYRVAK